MNEQQERKLIKAIAIVSGLMSEGWDPAYKKLHRLLISIWVAGLPEGFEPPDDFMISGIVDEPKNPK